MTPHHASAEPRPQPGPNPPGRPAIGGIRRLPGLGPTEAVRRTLRAVRSLTRLILVGRGVALLLALVASGITLAVLADYTLRFPGLLRALALLAGVGVLAWFAVREVIPALRFRPPLTVLALRIEKIAATQDARPPAQPHPKSPLPGVLAAGLELDPSLPDADRLGLGPVALREAVAMQAAAAFASARPRAVFNLRPLARASALLAVALAFGLTLAGMNPGLAGIGLARFFTPWRDVEWPARTGVEPGVMADVHPLGEALTLRAVLTKGEDQARVDAVYRLADEQGRLGPERRVTLTPQTARVVSDDGGRGRLYERILDPVTLEPAMAGLPQAQADPARPGYVPDRFIEVRFLTDDDASDRRRIRITPPPRVLSAAAQIDLPAYARVAPAAAAQATPAATPAPTPTPDRVRVGRVELPVSTDGRVRLGPLLAGSVARVELRFSKPVDVRGGVAPIAADAADPSLLRLDLTADRPLTERLEVADRFGLTPRDQPTLLVDVLDDRAPTVSILEPARDEDVLPTARVDVEAEAADDLGVTRLTLERSIAPGYSKEASDAAELAPVIAAESAFGPPAPSRLVRATVSLQDLGVAPGDEVVLVALAADAYVSAQGLPRDPARSSARRLRVISEDDLVEQVRARLRGVERTVREIDAAQGELARAAIDSAQAAPVRSAQGELARRIDRQRRSIEQLGERLDRNALDDRALRALIDDAQALAAEAARAADRAAQRLDEPDAEADEARRQAADLQARARDALGRLLERLDTGRDSFLARRGVERLLEDQRALAERTNQLQQDTLGQKPQDLAPEQREALDALAERQAELAERAREAIDRLAEGARQSQQNNPGQSAAMARAAESARQAGVPQELQQAASDIAQNQTSQASQRQAQAIDALQEALEQLDRADRNRDAALRRELAGLIETLRALVAAQTKELERLTARAAGAGDDVAPLDVAMIALNAATIDASERARTAAELAPVAERLTDAAAAQDTAVSALRQSPQALDRAEVAERESLAALAEALDQAQKADDNAASREQDRARAELRKAYAAALQEQRSIREATEPLAAAADANAQRDEAARLNREQRAGARRVGRRQDDLRASVAEIYRSNQGLADSAVVEFAHAQLEESTAQAAIQLNEGRPGEATLLEQDRAVDLLTTLVEAFSRFSPKRDDNFADDSGSGGSGSGQGGHGEQPPPLVESLAELRILRAMQAQILQLTRRVDALPDRRLGSLDPARLSAMQSTLAQQGQRVLEKLEQAQQRGRPPRPPRPDQAPDQAPAPPPGPGNGNDPDGGAP